jgi:hypothetical protein
LIVLDAYENLERIIIYGFLSVRISYGGHDLLIKNITDKEYQNINMVCSDKNKLKKNLLSLVYSVAFIDGVNVLDCRDHILVRLIEFFERAPALFVLKVVEALNELNNTYIDSIDSLEGYSYSNKSRDLWSTLDPYNRSSYTGIRGLDAIGLNSVQENWISINKRLDEEDKYEKDLNLTLLIVGASNYKSAKMLSKNHETHSQELKELRDEITKYGFDRKRVSENEKKRESWIAPLSSREDLVRELYRQMKGDKDQHDLYIDAWIEGQKQKAEQAKKSAENKQRAFREKVESSDMGLLEASRPISTYELNKILESKKNIKLNTTFMTGSEEVERKDRALKKISAQIIRPDLKDVGDGS